MDISDRNALAEAMKNITARTGIALPQEVADAHIRGDLKTIDTHDALRGAMPELHPLVRYLAVCDSYVRQPQRGEEPRLDLFYNIFAAARAVPMVRTLDRALATLPPSTLGLEGKLRELATGTTVAELESTIFELVTGARYRERIGAPVEFIHDKSRKSPDILCRADRLLAIECKKYDKYSEVSRELREVVNDLLVPTIMTFAEAEVSVLIDVHFRQDPKLVPEALLTRLAVESLTSGGRPRRSPSVAVVCRPLEPPDTSSFWLFPCPKFYDDRYGFFPGCEWSGLVQRMGCTMAGPSVVDDIFWEGAARWKLLDEELVWKKRKLNFKTMFSGVDQLRGWGDQRILHVALDRDPAVGPRPDSLIGFLNRLYGGRDKAVADWIVFNELMSFPTVTGHLDFREHAHQVSREGENSAPPVSLVYVDEGDVSGERGEWGIGPELPPL